MFYSQLIWLWVPAALRCLKETLSLWAVRRTTALLDGRWGGTQPNKPELSVELTGGRQFVLLVTSVASSQWTAEFTGVSPEREQPVTASTSLSLVRSDCGVSIDEAECKWWNAVVCLCVEVDQWSCRVLSSLWWREMMSLCTVKQRPPTSQLISIKMAPSSGLSLQVTWPSTVFPSLMKASTSVTSAVMESLHPAGSLSQVRKLKTNLSTFNMLYYVVTLHKRSWTEFTSVAFESFYVFMYLILKY